jgi:hypothetical protein
MRSRSQNQRGKYNRVNYKEDSPRTPHPRIMPSAVRNSHFNTNANLVPRGGVSDFSVTGTLVRPDIGRACAPTTSILPLARKTISDLCVKLLSVDSATRRVPAATI